MSERVLGIDFGLKRVGLAISDGLLAEPLMVLSNDEKVLGKIEAVCRQYSIGKIIIGLPESGIVDKVKEFAQRLEKLLHLSVFLEAETLTTQEAIAKMIEAGRSKKYRTSRQDAIAAALILQNYLDRTNV